MSDLRLYFRYVMMSFRSQMAYKASFLMNSLGNFVATVIEFAGIYALFARFGTIQGFGLAEVAVFYGTVNCAFAFSESFGRGFDIFHQYVRKGEFDRILLRPRSVLMQILGTEFRLNRAGRLLQGIIVLVWGLVSLKVNLSIMMLLLIFNSLIGSAALFTGFLVLQATASFFSVSSLEVFNAFTYGGVQMAAYPMSVYKKWFRDFFTFIIPMSCVSYFPLLGALRGENLWLAFTAPLAGIVFFLLTLRVFGWGIRHYCSTGS